MKQKKDRLYISGKISGLPREEYLRRFRTEARRMQREGWRVVNPTDFAVCRWPWLYRLVGYRLTLIYDLWRLSRCDAIYMMDGWVQSRGAKVELKMAQALGLPVIRQSTAKERKRKKSKGKSVSDHALGSAACH